MCGSRSYCSIATSASEQRLRWLVSWWRVSPLLLAMTPVNQIDPERLEELRKTGSVTLVDVRTDPEVARGLIAGSKHIPLNQLPGRYQELDPQGSLVVYCQSGARSAQACAWLAERGFEHVHNLQGGILAWTRAGLPLSAPE
jgi:rhodanese-related sulfurtransferase